MRVCIVAEVGSNHGGLLERAIALIDAAAAAGADAVKFQSWRADRMYPSGTQERALAELWQLPLDWLPRLKARCRERSVEFLCSVFDAPSLEAVDPYVARHKIASIEAASLVFVEEVLQRRKPTIISTGMMERAQVDELHGCFGSYPITWLHCTVAYPCPLEDADVRMMTSLPKPYGLSDHTLDPIAAPCAATALGASVVEKHMRGMELIFPAGRETVARPGSSPPDWAHSLDPDAFARMVKAIRATEKVLGSAVKSVREVERPYLRLRRGPLGLRGA